MEETTENKFFELGPKLTTKVAGHGHIRMVTMMNQAPIVVGDAEFWVQTLVTYIGEDGNLHILSQVPHTTLPAGYAFQDQMLSLIKIAEEAGKVLGQESRQPLIDDYANHVAYLNEQVQAKTEHSAVLQELCKRANDENLSLNARIRELEDKLEDLKNPAPAPKKKRGLGKQK